MLNEYDTTDPTTEPAAPSPEPKTRPIEQLTDIQDELEENITRLEPLHADKLLRMGLMMGLGMIIGAVVWVNLLRGENIWTPLHPSGLWLVLPGIALGTIFGGITWFGGRRLAAVRHIVELLTQAMDFQTLHWHHVILFGVLAAIPEEMLFRGAVQAQFGLLISALIFGLLHAISRLYFAYATIAGLLLGLLYIISGSLWLSIGAHFAVDVVTFWLLIRHRSQSTE